MASPSFNLDASDTRKIAIGFALALLGALTTWMLEALAPQLETMGTVWWLLLAALVSAVANALRKWINDTRPTLNQARDLMKTARPDL